MKITSLYNDFMRKEQAVYAAEDERDEIRADFAVQDCRTAFAALTAAIEHITGGIVTAKAAASMSTTDPEDFAALVASLD